MPPSTKLRKLQSLTDLQQSLTLSLPFISYFVNDCEDACVSAWRVHWYEAICDLLPCPEFVGMRLMVWVRSSRPLVLTRWPCVSSTTVVWGSVTLRILFISFSQAVAVYVHPVCRSVRCAPSPHLHPVQRSAAHLPAELLHAVAQWIPYPRYILTIYKLTTRLLIIVT